MTKDTGIQRLWQATGQFCMAHAGQYTSISTQLSEQGTPEKSGVGMETSLNERRRTAGGN